MDSSSTDAPRPLMEIRGARASSVIVHHVPPDSADGFLEWQRGITRAAEGFAGYQGTDVYPPAEPRQREWVVVIHFNNLDALRRWVDSPVRAEWIGKLSAAIGDFRLKMLPTGFGPWFAGLVRGPETGLPPSWKIALTVFLGLYPTVMMLTVLVSPHTIPWGKAVSMLIGNALSVALLQWAVMPALDKVLRPWLNAPKGGSKVLSVGGPVLILLLLGVLTVLFRQLTG
jgi:antibiotic biosynthesis monooxygenase (ABM) superfamily enzyme